MIEVAMPRLSDSMEEGTLIRWLKRDGERVASGDELVEVETDKATVTVSAEDEGVLSVVAAEGTTVAVGELIARLAPASEDLDVAPQIADKAPAEPAPPAVASATAAPAAATTEGVAEGLADGVADGTAEGQADRVADGVAEGNGHPPATPLARRAARHHGVPLANVSGTGPRGRITRDDVLEAAGIATPPTPDTARPGPPAPSAAHGAQAPAPPAAAGPPAADGAAAQPFSRLQQLIARRMTESRTTIPEFEVQTDVAMDEAIALRERLRDAVDAVDAEQPLPSLNDLVVRACALTLRRHPGLNASYATEALRVWPNVNIGVAVATDAALVVPVLRDADALSLGRIAQETRRLAERVRTGQISPAELEGGTFTVSNLGMYGMTAIRPVINFPQVAILGVGAARDTLARVGDGIADRKLMTLTLSADHRAVYGADAARFLADLRDLLEAPLGILV